MWSSVISEARPPPPAFATPRAQDPADCESVQFISSLLPVAAAAGSPRVTESLHLAWGINDCEARHATVHMADVWDALVPLKQKACDPLGCDWVATGVCTPEKT